MPSTPSPTDRQPLFVYNGGFLSDRRVARILSLSGWQVRLGAPGPQGWVGVWGASPTSYRGEGIARATGAGVLRVEDAFLRGLFPGRVGGATMGLCLDREGVHFDASAPSELERLLADAEVAPENLTRAADALERMRYWEISKFAATRVDLAPPAEGAVIVVDQARDDASVRASGADEATFRDMLQAALDSHPGRRVLIKQHPETVLGARAGYYSEADESDRVRLCRDPISPWRLFEGAEALYTVSSGLGLEAIWAGLRPRVFGTPFYAGWGLTRGFRRLYRPRSENEGAALAPLRTPRMKNRPHSRPAMFRADRRITG